MNQAAYSGISVKFKIALIFSSLLTACQAVDAQRGFVDFEKHTLDEQMQGGYGVELADLDGDGLVDVVALATNPAQFVWYKNPSWEKYLISSATQANIDAAPQDIDGDGDVDLVLASAFDLGASTEGGLIHWLENPGNPVQNQEWAMHNIDQLPTSHRVKWADLNGDGRDELINLPIIGVGAQAPAYDINVSLRAYAIPRDLNVSRWPGVVLDESLQLSHGLSIYDWDGDGRQDILTASFYGIHLFQLATRGQAVAKRFLGIGKQNAERPAIGSSEVDVGTLSADTRFIASIEPWHGNEVVVYSSGSNADALWTREVIASDLSNGHGLLVADLDNDGSDEIIAGGRSEPFQLSVFQNRGTVSDWQRFDLDSGGIAVSGLAIEDINGDGFKDIVAIGASTQNVVYYQNTGR